MSGFDPLKLEWKGVEYEVAPNRCLGLLAAIEQIVDPGQGRSVIDVLAEPHKAHLTKLARAYGAALRYADCKVTDEEVYLSLARSVMHGGPEGFMALKTLADGILAMFFPDWAKEEVGNTEGDAETKTPTPPVEKSSNAE